MKMFNYFRKPQMKVVYRQTKEEKYLWIAANLNTNIKGNRLTNEQLEILFEDDVKEFNDFDQHPLHSY